MTHTPLTSDEQERARLLLCELQTTIRDSVMQAKAAQSPSTLSGVAEVTQADIIYQIDKVSEAILVEWFETHWPQEWPVELVFEGCDEGEPTVIPQEVSVEATRFKCIIDPIDGTRGIMYDKRSAWVLTGLAYQRGHDTSLKDIFVAAMTELPTSKQWRSDQISGIRGCGLDGLSCVATNVFTQEETPLQIQPSTASDLEHSFAQFTLFFPCGKTLLAKVATAFWKAMFPDQLDPAVFDDQYMSTGGQFYELLVGHDRMQVDVRPLAHHKLGVDSALVCHPYDVCTAMLLEEAGVIVEDAEGHTLDVPLNILTPVSFVCFANETIAEKARPLLHQVIKQKLL